MRLTARSPVAVSPAAALSWCRRPAALRRLTPPSGWIELLRESTGDRPVFHVRAGALRGRLAIERSWADRPPRLVERQIEGPFSRWEQVTTAEPRGAGGATLVDEVHVACRLASERCIERRLEEQYDWRHRVAAGDLARHARFADRASLVIAVSGASGLVGSSLADFLEAGGQRVLRLTRGAAPGPGAVRWDPAAGVIDAEALAGVDAVVHLAGESVAGGRWTRARKEAIRGSRLEGTRLLAETLARLERPPAVLVQASAIGYYGDRGEEPLDESSAAGSGFLAETCREWEAASLAAEQAGVRVVRLRIGVVLAARGGALAKMLLPFRLGLGGRLGSGKQLMSWIALDDLVGIVQHAIFDPSLSGAVNATAPTAARNVEFTRVLGAVLRRPAALPVPAFALRLLFGEMGRELLLAGALVRPARLERAGFRFLHADLESALRFELGLADPRTRTAEIRIDRPR